MTNDVPKASGVNYIIKRLKKWFLQSLLWRKFYVKGNFKEVEVQNWQSNLNSFFFAVSEWTIGFRRAITDNFGIRSSATHWYQDVAPNLQFLFPSSHLIVYDHCNSVFSLHPSIQLDHFKKSKDTYTCCWGTWDCTGDDIWVNDLAAPPIGSNNCCTCAPCACWWWGWWYVAACEAPSK